MKNNRIQCGWCGSDTTRTYKLKDGRYLCYTCTEKHFEIVKGKMEHHIQQIQYRLKKKEERLKKFKEDGCDHFDFLRTGYAVGRGDNMKEICICNNCGKRLYESPAFTTVDTVYKCGTSDWNKRLEDTCEGCRYKRWGCDYINQLPPDINKLLPDGSWICCEKFEWD